MSLNHVVVINLIPQDLTDAEYLQVREATKGMKETILQSADDAAYLAAAGLPGSKVKVWWAGRWADPIAPWLFARGVPLVELMPEGTVIEPEPEPQPEPIPVGDYLHGANVPWAGGNWTQDFGGGGNGLAARILSGGSLNLNNPTVQAFAAARESGVRHFNWWMFQTADRSGPYQLAPAGGKPTGVLDGVYADVDAALLMAEELDLYLVLAPIPRLSQLPANWYQADLDALIGVLRPLFARYKDNPRLFAWSAGIENGWDLDVWNGTRSVPAAAARAYMSAFVQAVKAEAPETLVTVNGAMLDELPHWTGLGFDFMMASWYDYMNNRNSHDGDGGGWCALCMTADEARVRHGLTEPLAIGEYYAGPNASYISDGADGGPVGRIRAWKEKGYAGAFAWSLFPEFTSDQMTIDWQAMRDAFAELNPPVYPWFSPDELAALPRSGAGYDLMKATADLSPTPNLCDQNNRSNATVLACAAMYHITGSEAYRVKATDYLTMVMGTEAGPDCDEGGKLLSLSRNIGAYALAAQLLNYYDEPFVTWMAGLADRVLWSAGGDHSLRASAVGTSEHKAIASNHGCASRASLLAVAHYLGDMALVDEVAQAFHDYLGRDGSRYHWDLAESQWQASYPDESGYRGINPVGAAVVIDGVHRYVDGSTPEDLKRIGGRRWPIPRSSNINYLYEGMDYTLATAYLLSRIGYPDVWEWEDSAILRFYHFTHSPSFAPHPGRTGQPYEFALLGADVGDSHQTILVNAVYGTDFPTGNDGPGKHGMGHWAYLTGQ